MPGQISFLNTREKTLSLFFVLFFAFAVFQQKNRREDWPFSFFGMYQGTSRGGKITHYDLDYIAPGEPPRSLYGGANGYYYFDKFNEIGNRRRVSNRNEVLDPGGDISLTPETMEKFKLVLASDALPTAVRQGLNDPRARIRLRYRLWLNFKPQDLHQPWQDIVILEPTLAELERWAE